MKPIVFNGITCSLKIGSYENGRPAIRLEDDEMGEPFATATVNLPDAHAAPGEVFIKNHAELEGMLEALEDAGVVKRTGRTVRSGHAEIPTATLLVDEIKPCGDTEQFRE